MNIEREFNSIVGQIAALTMSSSYLIGMQNIPRSEVARNNRELKALNQYTWQHEEIYRSFCKTLDMVEDVV